MVLVEGGVPLVGFATDEAIEIVEAQPVRPAIKGADAGGLVVGHIVVFAKPGGAIAVALENLPDGRRTLGNQPRIAGIGRGQFLNRARPDGMVIAPGQNRGTGGRTEGRGVEGVVAQSVGG